MIKLDTERMVNIGQCCHCKCPMLIPGSLYTSARRDHNINFYCSYGHKQHFSEGESEETKLRRERDRLQQRIAEKDDDIRRHREQRDAAERRASAARGQVTKLKNRAAAGVCPCCNRTFSQLARHMKAQHPGFTAEEVG